MLSVLIGIIIGFVMGVTGAGGALVAIPLFMHFLEMSLKDASLYSLLAVILASLSNFFYQRKNVIINIASTLIIFSALGSLIAQPYKKLIPDIGIKILLSVISFYSLYALWVPKKLKIKDNVVDFRWRNSIIIGIALGLLTTFTGLGGGVLLLPVLLGIYNLSEDKAVATSLFVIGLSSLVSFVVQVSQNSLFEFDMNIIFLLLGILITSSTLRFILERVSFKIISYVRKIIFSMVVFFAMAKLFS